jgi:hypothetical protein
MHLQYRVYFKCYRMLIFNMQLGEYNIPTLKKRSNKNANPKHDRPVELFPSSGESDEEVGLGIR